MKRLTFALLALAAIAVTAASAADKAAPVYADGTYMLRYDDPELGKVTVGVTVAEGRISRIEFPEGMGDAAMDADALDGYIASIIALQDPLKVDAVSGATQSSDLLKYAVQRALAPAVRK